jgi:hypothetical protein
MSEFSAPLTPADCDLTDFGFMPLDVNRLRKSKAWLWARRQPELGFFMLNLWAVSWHEKPAASLEDDDDVLADAAMCDPKRWAKVRDKVLHGWIKCSDGRLYHPVVAEKAIEAWASKRKQRHRTANATVARKLATKTVKSVDEQRNDDRNDDVTFTKGQGQGQGQGQEKKKEDDDDPPQLVAARVEKRVCEILRIELQANPERVTWRRQIEEMLRDGLDEPSIIAATEIARNRGITKLSYIRAVAFARLKPPSTASPPNGASDEVGERLKAKWAAEDEQERRLRGGAEADADGAVAAAASSSQAG